MDNLVLIYDDNSVTCDGPLSWINSEHIDGKMRASGWNILGVPDGSYDMKAICSALENSRHYKGKPTFIQTSTIIGIGTTSAGTAKAHHGAFDVDSVKASKIAAGQDPNLFHSPSQRGLKYFRERKSHGEELEKSWRDLMTRYTSEYPAKAADLSARMRGAKPDVEKMFQNIDSNDFVNMPTRESNGLILAKLWKEYSALCGGGADPVNSNKFVYSESDVFGPGTDYKGNYIRYGIREHAMASISNGLAAFNPGTFLPVTATFLIFYLYVSFPRDMPKAN